MRIAAWLVGIAAASVLAVSVRSGCAIDFGERSPEHRSRPEAWIDRPRQGTVIIEDVFDEVGGRVDNLPPGKTLWTFIHSRHGYYLQYPPPVVHGKAGTFEQTNVRLASPGRWEIHVCLATADASARLHAAARRGEWYFPLLPEGVELLDSVTVLREKER